jgi:hypothetical protein
VISDAKSRDLPTSFEIDYRQFPEVEREQHERTNNTSRVFYIIRGHKIARSRFLMERHLGRKLNSDEVVHHLNGNGLDDRIENLRVMSRKDHSSLHSSMKNRPKYNLGSTRTFPPGGCIIQKMVGKHGPYLYHVQRVNGRQYWKYLGKVGSARAQAAQAAHARNYHPDDEEDAPIERVGKFGEVVER